MDQFEVFFTFYSLILGLAATEILSSVGAYVRARPLRSLEIQSALLAFQTFLVICATWIDAWTARSNFDLSFASMWAPIGAATCYYLAAVVVLPRAQTDYDDMATYFRSRKPFVVVTLLAAEIFVKVTFIPDFIANFYNNPRAFWWFSVPLNGGILTLWLLLLIVQKRPLIIAVIAAQALLFTVPYWVA